MQHQPERKYYLQSKINRMRVDDCRHSTEVKLVVIIIIKMQVEISKQVFLF